MALWLWIIRIYSVLNERKLLYFIFIVMQTESLSTPIVNFYSIWNNIYSHFKLKSNFHNAFNIHRHVPDEWKSISCVILIFCYYWQILSLQFFLFQSPVIHSELTVGLAFKSCLFLFQTKCHILLSKAYQDLIILSFCNSCITHVHTTVCIFNFNPFYVVL
jgi:hypothetical protein